MPRTSGDPVEIITAAVAAQSPFIPADAKIVTVSNCIFTFGDFLRNFGQTFSNLVGEVRMTKPISTTPLQRSLVVVSLIGHRVQRGARSKPESGVLPRSASRSRCSPSGTSQ